MAPRPVPPSPLLVVKGWDDVVKRFQANQYRHTYFESHVYPKLSSKDLIDLIPRFEKDYDWLLDFQENNELGLALRKFQTNPVDMVAIIRGYLGAWRYAALRQYLISSFRLNPQWLVLGKKREVEVLSSEPLQEDLEPHDTQRSSEQPETFWQLSQEGSDADFLREITDYDPRVVSNRYRRGLELDEQSSLGTLPVSKAIGYVKTIGSIKSFVNLLQGPDKVTADDTWQTALQILQKKIFEKPSEIIARQLLSNLDDENRKLRDENASKEKELQKYRGIVSDLSFRHLLEMLAKAADDAKQVSKERSLNQTEPTPPQKGKSQKKGKTGKRNAPPEAPVSEASSKSSEFSDEKNKDPQWQDFWKDAWAKAIEGTKEGTLRDLWLRSDGKKGIRRTQIRGEGDRIFGLLSANIHDCEALFDTEHCHDSVRKNLLDALKPLEGDQKDGKVDWDEEVKRYI